MPSRRPGQASLLALARRCAAPYPKRPPGAQGRSPEPTITSVIVWGPPGPRGGKCRNLTCKRRSDVGSNATDCGSCVSGAERGADIARRLTGGCASGRVRSVERDCARSRGCGTMPPPPREPGRKRGPSQRRRRHGRSKHVRDHVAPSAASGASVEDRRRGERSEPREPPGPGHHRARAGRDHLRARCAAHRYSPAARICGSTRWTHSG